MFNKLKNKKGFTIIELIVVMAIIGILVLLAVPKFMGYTEKARFTKFISTTKQIENASERYYMDNQDWPRLSDTPYTADQINLFSQKIYDATGKEATLDEAGNYYDIDYTKLSQYVKAPDDEMNYVIQNPVGNIYAFEDITPEATVRLETGGVLLNKTTLALNVGALDTLVATIIPTTSINKNVGWTSSNISVATVDATGKVTAIGNGTTTITVKTENGGYTETCDVTVTTMVTTVTLNTNSTSVTVGSTVQLTATILPTTATNKTGTWSSSNTAIATVSNTGLVTSKASGNAVITIKTTDGDFTASSTIIVNTPVIIQTFNYTGNYQSWTVPNTGSYKLETWGSSGGSISTGIGGNGGYTYGQINLNKGQILYLYVGQQGTSGYSANGGWNGGGSSSGGNGPNVASGGGSTDIRTISGTWNNISSLQSRIIVAGGGGGGSNYNVACKGGDGGGLAGQNGQKNSMYSTTTFGYGGTQITGGLSPNGVGGGLGYGGASSTGGGGSGYYGGGSGQYLSSGGGGSSYTGTLQNSGTTSGSNTGNGKVTITFIN